MTVAATILRHLSSVSESAPPAGKLHFHRNTENSWQLAEASEKTQQESLGEGRGGGDRNNPASAAYTQPEN